MSLAKSLFKAAQDHEKKRLLVQGVPEAQITQTKWSAIGEPSQAYWKAVAEAAEAHFSNGTLPPVKLDEPIEPIPPGKFERREAFIVPDGWKAELDDEGRPTGKLVGRHR